MKVESAVPHLKKIEKITTNSLDHDNVKRENTHFKSNDLERNK